MQKKLGLDPNSPLPVAEATEHYKRLGTVEATAKAMGRTQKIVRAALKEAGITTRRKTTHLDAHLEELRRAYLDEHVNTAELAERYGVEPGVMHSYLSYRGIVRYRHLGPDDRARIRQLRAEGLSKSEIARAMGIAIPTVIYHLSEEPGSAISR